MGPTWHILGTVAIESSSPDSVGRSSRVFDGSAPRFQCRCVGVPSSTESRFAVIFAGRLDEVGSLERKLGLHSGADPLVLVREAYRKWGASDFAAHLYGDFSIVLWDNAAQTLTLSRSHSGFFPLCYSLRGNGLHFADTPQGLLSSGAVAATLDEESMTAWFVLQPRLTSHTFFNGIQWVQPGTSAVYTRGKLTISNFWRPESIPTLRLRDHREYADALRETLRDAVRDRLLASQENVASQLSGGLDSSSVTALAAEELAPSGRRIYAFTAVPGTIKQDPVQGRFFDESSHAAAVAAKYPNIEHTLVRAETTSLFEVLDRYTDAEAAPPFNPHHLQWIDSTYAAASAMGATTMLTGSMGNMTISRAGNLVLIDALQRGRFGQAAKLFLADRRRGARALRHVPGALTSAFAPGILDWYDRRRQSRSSVTEFTGVRPEFARAHGFDVDRWNRRFPYQTVEELTLRSIDRFDFGMFNESPRHLYGLNPTDPTYDRRVIELTLSIPPEQFCADGVPRALIRTAMEGRLPDIVRLERRRGLQSADFLSLLGRERTAIAEELSRMNEIDILRRAMDIPLLQQRLNWTEQQAIAYGWHPYSNRLMRALSMGRFVRRMTEGSLFGSRETNPATRPDAVLIQM